MTWSQMNIAQRATCVVLIVPTLVAYAMMRVILKACESVGLE